MSHLGGQTTLLLIMTLGCIIFMKFTEVAFLLQKKGLNYVCSIEIGGFISLIYIYGGPTFLWFKKSALWFFFNLAYIKYIVFQK